MKKMLAIYRIAFTCYIDETAPVAAQLQLEESLDHTVKTIVETAERTYTNGGEKVVGKMQKYQKI